MKRWRGVGGREGVAGGLQEVFMKRCVKAVRMGVVMGAVVVGAIVMSAGMMSCEKKAATTPSTGNQAPVEKPNTPPTTASPTPAVPPTAVAPSEPEIPIMVQGFRSDRAVIEALRKGGYVLVLRHARTNMEQLDQQGTNFEDCSKQRVLTEQGKEDAKKIGEWVKQIGMPVGKVISSPFCRNKETAQLAFGTYTLDAAVMGKEPEWVAKRQALISTPPAAGTNTVIVGHQKEMTASTGLDMNEFGEGAALVCTPTGGPGGGFQIVHVIRFDEWEKLAKAAGEGK